MSDNLQKLVGLVAMAVLVVLGVVLTNDDDTDFSRNRSFSSATALSSGTAKADCCDQTLALLESMQTQLTQIGSQLQTHLSEEAEASTSGTSPDVQEIADQMAETCPGADPATWVSVIDGRDASNCVRQYLVGLPLELARQVVLAHGKFGFFQRWNFDLAMDENWGPNSTYLRHWALTEEACEPIFYGYNPPPRLAIAVDTYQGVVLPLKNQFLTTEDVSGYFQDKAQAEESLQSESSQTWSAWLNKMYWPTEIEEGYGGVALCPNWFP
jgi:hypothetical protein